MKTIDELFYDEANVKFWKREGEKYKNLYWVKAMIDIESATTAIETIPLNFGKINLSVLAKYREIAYNLLNKGLSNPTPELGSSLISGDLTDSIRDISIFRVNKDALDLFNSYLGNDNDETLEILREEYTRLFYDSYMPFVPPYESVYRGERQVHGKFTWKVNDFYRKFGLIVDGEEMPDHIAHECEFISLLSQYEYENRSNRNLEEAEKYHKAIREFLSQHLLFWGDKFYSDLLSLTKMPFYRALALLGKSIFVWEYNYINRGDYGACLEK